ncbi:hypothetical protein H5410_043346 [Solanum commersonii]|uniref:Uncharacterized protein n=1 Tax=Solanum commersonii TaxID=4109 RepID=A0A9J5Y001_SOLCO|nr:hypothetical protein H5410_043346 [Solanum commersonii]
MAYAINRTSYYVHGRNSINGQINFIYPYSSSSSHCRNILISFIFPAFVELLQLKYQPTNTSPFEIHPIKMYLSVVSFIICCFAYDLQIKYMISTTSNYSNYAKMVGDIFGSLAFASYSSLLNPPFSFFFYTLCALYYATLLLNTTVLKARLYRIYHNIVNYFNKPAATTIITYQV